MSGLVERGAILERIRFLIEAGRAGAGGRLLLEGEGGIGKTALLDEAADLARAADCRVLRAAGHPLETALGWGVVRQLLEPEVARLSAEERAELTAGPAREALTMLEGGQLTEPDELELVHATFRLLRELSRRGPILALVDDLQWADRSSLLFLIYAAQRLADVAICLTLRPGEPGGPDELIARLAGEFRRDSLRLDGLTSRGSSELVRSRHPEASEEFCEAAAQVTSGNPLLLVELLDALGSEAKAPDAITRLLETSSLSLQRTTQLRLAGTGAEGRQLAEAVAVLEPHAPLHRVARLSLLTPEAATRAADSLVAAGILRTPDPAAFAHPLIRSTVRAMIPEAERARRHAVAARLAAADGADHEQIATHLVRSPAAGDPSVVQILRRAAVDARARAAADSACRYLERALAEPPGPEVRPHVLADLAEAEMLVGRMTGLGRLDEALAALHDHQDPTLLVRLGDVLFQSGRYDDAAAAFDRALSQQPGDQEVRARVHACRLAMEALRPDGRVEPDLEAQDAAGSGVGSRFLDVHLALASVMGIGDHRQAGERAWRALGDGRLIREQGVRLDLLVGLGCLVWSDRFDQCLDLIDQALVVAEDRAAHLGRAHLMFGRSWIRYWSGDLERGVADAGEAIETWRGGWNGQIHFARFWSAVSLIELDRLDEAAGVLDQAEQLEGGADSVGVATLEVARGRLASARGSRTEAAEHLSRAVEAARALPFLGNPTVLPWRSEAALALRAIGRHEEAVAWAEEELEVAQRYGAPRALGVALRARALLSSGDEAVTLLEAAARALESSPARLELARVRIDLGSAHRRAGRRSEAVALLQQGLEESARMGAVRLERRARSELAAAGIRPRRTAASGPESLTASERRVCELAARGHTNPEIASELFLSRRTVEFHLSGAFRKLGISSRSELSTALGDSPQVR